MRVWRRVIVFLGASLGAVAGSTSAAEPFLAPEVALAASHLRASERPKLAAVLGPLESLPLYRVELDADPQGRSVSGTVELSQWVKEGPLSELFFQVTPNAQGTSRVSVADVVVNGVATDPVWTEPSRFRVTVRPAVESGGTVRVKLRIRARVPTIRDEPIGGFLQQASAGQREATDYGAFGASEGVLSLTGLIPRVPPMRPDGTPRDGPSGMGDLALYDPANLALGVKVPRGAEVLTTGLETGQAPDGLGNIRYAYVAAAARDFPLFVTQGYESQSRKVGDVIYSVHHAPEHGAAGKRVLDYAIGAVTELEKRFGPLPYTRFRVVEAPLQSGAGGMEFPGLISVSANLMSGGLSMLDQLGIPPDMRPMVKELVATTSSLESVVENTLEFTVAHEVAHQYFPCLVGSDPIAEPAADETLAQYVALLYLEWKHGKAASDVMRNGQLVASYQLFRMVGGKDGAVDRATGAFESSLEYAALVYGKGPLLHEAERKLLGDRPFLQATRRYVDGYRYRWACRDCFTRTLAKEAPGQSGALEQLRRHWWDEAHGDADLGTIESMPSLQGGASPTDPKVQELMDEVLRAFE